MPQSFEDPFIFLYSRCSAPEIEDLHIPNEGSNFYVHHGV